LPERKAIVQQAFSNNPERFVKGVAAIQLPPKKVCINKSDDYKKPKMRD
jgi:hypothetical protein